MSNKEKYEEIYQIIDQIEKYEEVDVDKALTNTYKKIEKQQRRKWFNRALKYAAVFLLPLMGLYILFENKSNRVIYSTDEVVEVIAAPGTVVRYTLPDSTVVWLNSNSKLKYPQVFKEGKREINLDGEGFFEVKSSPTDPFLVHTSYGLSTYVYGTSFNISAYTEDGVFNVSLISGKLDVVMPSNERMNLPIGKKAYLSDNKLLVEEADVLSVSKWKDGVLIFNNMPLPDILKKLERYYNVEIELNVKAGVDVGKYSLRSIFRNETIEQILDYLSETIGATWSYKLVDQTTSTKHIKISIR